MPRSHDQGGFVEHFAVGLLERASVRVYPYRFSTHIRAVNHSRQQHEPYCAMSESKLIQNKGVGIDHDDPAAPGCGELYLQVPNRA